MNIKCVVFDLDGTLVNSAKNIYHATIHSFNSLNVKADLPYKKFYLRIGHHFEDIFDEFGIEVGSFDRFIEIYKSHYFDYIHYSVLYPGVEETINTLKGKEYKVALLTTKGQEQADKIINHFGFRNNFDYVMGRRPGIAHKPSPEPLLKICEELNIKPEEILMIGDTELDIRCGKNAGAKTCAVTYGYRSKELLEMEKPDFSVDDINELLNLF